jgi:3-oxoacyl-[acyl-carrier-protein] synthase III
MATSGLLENIAMRGISCAAPDNVVGNSAFVDQFGAEAVESFIRMTGVNSRCITLPAQTASDLAFVAATRLLESIGWRQDTIDGIIFVSQTPDYKLPATSCLLQHRLGLSKNCIAFDVNLGCSGFVYGVFIAGSLCRKDRITRMLLCGGDTITKLVAKEDKSSAMLFGDSGFAVALEYSESTAPWNYLFQTDGSGFKNIIVPAGGFRHPDGNREMREFGEGIWRADHNLYMNGINVFNFTISEVTNTIKQLMSQAGITEADIDMLVLHQANLFILKHIAKMTKFPMGKVPVSMDRYGNTSVASIPLTLCDAFNRTFDKADKGIKQLILSGFGVGLSWGVVNLELDPAVCLPVAYSNDYFNDGDVEV